MTLRENILAFKQISTPDTISPETLGNILLALLQNDSDATEGAQISSINIVPAEYDATIIINTTSGTAKRATIPCMDKGLAGLYTPTRHAAVMAAISPAFTNLEIEQLETFCRLWITTAGGNRVNIAQIPAMTDGKAGLFTPTRLAAINNTISQTVRPVDTRLAAIEKLIQSDTDGAINKFNEIIRFLEGIKDTTSLSAIIDGIIERIDDCADAQDTTVRLGNLENTTSEHTEQIAEVRDDITTLFQTEKTVAQHSRELTDLSDEIQTVATRENARWAAPAYITLADRVSGVTVETSSTLNTTATSDYVYDTATGNILLRQTPAIISAANPVRYYFTWAGRDALDITANPGGIGYIPAQGTALRPYPGRLYIFAGATGIWCTAADGKLRKIADVCSCSATKL